MENTNSNRQIKKAKALIEDQKKIFRSYGWEFPKDKPALISSYKIIPLPTRSKNGLAGIYPPGIVGHTGNESYLLGDYKIIGNKPQIIIYMNVLVETAKKLEKEERYKNSILHFLKEGVKPDYGILKAEAAEFLFYCVVLNEAAKWILVDILDSNGNTWRRRNPLVTKDHLHEALTALFSSLICKKKKGSNLEKTFDWLIKTQALGDYREYKTLNGSNIKDIVKRTEVARFKNIKSTWEHKMWENLIPLISINPLSSINGNVRKSYKCQDMLIEKFLKEKVKQKSGIMGTHQEGGRVWNLLSDKTKSDRDKAIRVKKMNEKFDL